ncbi:MAG: DUF5684 domain-containing protein [Bacteroidota bacterium]
MKNLSLFSIIIGSVIVIFLIITLWRIFTKAGEKGWKAIVPGYNLLVILKIVKKDWWWIFLFLIMVVNFVILFILSIELARVFGKKPLFGIGLLIFPVIFYPILAYNKSVYKG